MKLTDILNPQILNKAEWEAKGYELPKYNITEVAKKTHDEPTWLHFGAGNIFRAFPAAILNAALNSGKYDRGVIVAESFDYEIIDKAYNLVLIPLVLAGYARFLKALDDNGNPFTPSTDPKLEELQAIVAPLELGKPDQDFSCLKKLYSRKDIFNVDLYEVDLGEQIEGMVKELYAGPGAVRKTLHKYVSAR